MPRLSIRTPDEPDRIVAMDADEFVIGRGRKATLTIKDKHLSREHCRIHRGNGAYLLTDLGSANGVKLNERRVRGSVRLTTGDIIQLGRTSILFVADAPDDDDEVDTDDGDAGGGDQTIMLDEIDQGLDEEAPAPDPQRPPRFVLQYKRGAHRRFLPLGKGQLNIGRHKSCGLILRDNSVSSCHAAIKFRNGRYEIQDMGSTNGIKVNGNKVEQATLRPGMRIRLGNVLLSFKQVVSRDPAQKMEKMEDNSGKPAPPLPTTIPAAPSPAAAPAQPPAPPTREVLDDHGRAANAPGPARDRLPDLPLEEEVPEEDVLVTTDDSDQTPQWGRPASDLETEARPNPVPADAENGQARAAGVADDASPANAEAKVGAQNGEPGKEISRDLPPRLRRLKEHKALAEQEWIEVKLETDPNLPRPEPPLSAPVAAHAAEQQAPPPPPSPAPPSPGSPPLPPTIIVPDPAAGRSRGAEQAASSPGSGATASAPSPAELRSRAGKSDAELKQIMDDLDDMLQDFEPSPADTSFPSPAGEDDTGAVAAAQASVAAPGRERARDDAPPVPETAQPPQPRAGEGTAPPPPGAEQTENQRERRLFIRLVMTVVLVIGLLLIFLVPWGRIFAPPRNRTGNRIAGTAGHDTLPPGSGARPAPNTDSNGATHE